MAFWSNGYSTGICDGDGGDYGDIGRMAHSDAFMVMVELIMVRVWFIVVITMVVRMKMSTKAFKVLQTTLRLRNPRSVYRFLNNEFNRSLCNSVHSTINNECKGRKA